MIKITRGSDAEILFQINDSLGTPFPVFSAVMLEQSPQLKGRLTLQGIDFSLGFLSVKLEGTDPLPVGRYSFRWQANLMTGDTLGSPEIFVNVV
jgi:hypothetical protein